MVFPPSAPISSWLGQNSGGKIQPWEFFHEVLLLEVHPQGLGSHWLSFGIFPKCLTLHLKHQQRGIPGNPKFLCQEETPHPNLGSLPTPSPRLQPHRSHLQRGFNSTQKFLWQFHCLDTAALGKKGLKMGLKRK